MKRRVEIEVIVNSLRFRFGMSLAFGLIGTDIALARGPLFPGPVYPADAGPISVATCDLDGDQRLDVVVANLDNDNVSVLMGVGDGTFVAAVNYAAGDGPISVAIGDLDGDQVPDLVVGNGPRTVIEEFRRIKSTDVVLSTSTGQDVRIRCVTTPDEAQRILLGRLGVKLPARLGEPNWHDGNTECSQ